MHYRICVSLIIIISSLSTVIAPAALPTIPGICPSSKPGYAFTAPESFFAKGITPDQSAASSTTQPVHHADTTTTTTTPTPLPASQEPDNADVLKAIQANPKLLHYTVCHNTSTILFDLLKKIYLTSFLYKEPHVATSIYNDLNTNPDIAKLLKTESIPLHEIYEITFHVDAHSLIVEKKSNGTNTWWRIYQSWMGKFDLAQWLGLQPWPLANTQYDFDIAGNNRALNQQEITLFLKNMFKYVDEDESANLNMNRKNASIIVYRVNPTLLPSNYTTMIAISTYAHLPIAEPDKLLLLAADYNSLQGIKDALDRGAHINITDEQGNTPLIIATQHNNTSVIEYLLQQPAINVTAKNKEGYYALYNTVLLHDNAHIAKLLLQHPHTGINLQIYNEYKMLYPRSNAIALVLEYEKKQKAEEKQQESRAVASSISQSEPK